MSIIILILSLNGSLTTVQIPQKVSVEACEQKSLSNVTKRYRGGMGPQVISAKCFSTVNAGE